MTERDSLSYAQPAGEPYAGVSETLSAVVFFAGDRAYKLKKPVSTGFLDFSTPQARAAACQRETELNRRFALDVYLGVAQVRDPDRQVCDHLVVMRRMPAACLEFDDRLRWLDGLDDAAFLAMDLERLGARELAERFTGWYIEYSGDPAPRSLRHHYVAYRAFVRAKVACLRSGQGDQLAGGEARQLAP